MEKGKSSVMSWVIVGTIAAMTLYSIFLLYWKMYFVGK